MSDPCATYTFAGVTVNGAEDTDTLVFTDESGDGVQGLDGAPIRRQVDDVAADDGGIDQGGLWGARIIPFKGHVHIGTEPAQSSIVTAAYLTKSNVLQAAVIAALEAVLNTPSTLAWTPLGLTARSISCVYGMPGGEIQFTGPAYKRAFAFTLLAENPTITIAP